ncbi:uncharacterized protein LOC141930066 [Strix aluco]|uniref:uncharacterized protein LOC141930066 n=1 Tax=Strix aluco TaxID=111821 RepID=UPI003DA1F395
MFGWSRNNRGFIAPKRVEDADEQLMAQPCLHPILPFLKRTCASRAGSRAHPAPLCADSLPKHCRGESDCSRCRGACRRSPRGSRLHRLWLAAPSLPTCRTSRLQDKHFPGAGSAHTRDFPRAGDTALGGGLYWECCRALPWCYLQHGRPLALQLLAHLGCSRATGHPAPRSHGWGVLGRPPGARTSHVLLSGHMNTSGQKNSSGISGPARGPVSPSSAPPSPHPDRSHPNAAQFPAHLHENPCWEDAGGGSSPDGPKTRPLQRYRKRCDDK